MVDRDQENEDEGGGKDNRSGKEMMRISSPSPRLQRFGQLDV